ncbi:MAG: GNAT family N-acetyltransferase [Verrucomicrobiota bacterium]
MPNTQVHWLTTPEEFVPWVDAWRDLLRRSIAPPTPFHDPAWILGCWRCPRNRIAVGLISEGEVLRVGLVCNAEYDAGHAMLVPVRTLGFTPHISAAYPARLVAVADDHPPTEITILLERALRHFHWQVMFLHCLRPSNAWLEAAVLATANVSGWRIRPGEASIDAFLDTTGGAAGYLANRANQFRGNQRRARNQLLAMGTLTAVEVARGDVPNEAIEAELIDCFSRCWQRDSISSPLHPTMRPHLFRLLAEMRKEGLLRVYFLRLNGQAIAFEFGFVDRHPGGLYYVCARGYDDAWKRQSPGNLLTELTLDDTDAAGLRGIYLGPITLGADNGYKQTWLTAEWEVRTLMLIRPRTIYGLLDSCYEGCALFRKVWWKLELGQRLRRLFWFFHGPTG